MPFKRISAISETGGRIDDEAMNEEEANTKDQRFKYPCER